MSWVLQFEKDNDSFFRLRALGGNNLESLQNYLQKFPSGRHAVQARNEVDELSHPAMAARAPDIPASGSRASVPTDDKNTVLNVVKQYQKGYQDKQLDELKEIWPGMTQQQIKTLGVFFDSASTVTLSYNIIGDPEINGDRATVTFMQSIGYTIKGQSEKLKPAKILMKLKKGDQENWHIDSIK